MILFIILGAILFFVGYSLKNNFNNPLGKHADKFKIAGVVIALLGILSGMFVQVNAGKVGVKSLYGSVQPDIIESGLNIVNPFMDITNFDIQTDRKSVV